MIDLKEQFGKQVRVSLEESWEGGDKTPYRIIRGKRGDIMAWDDALLEVTVYGRELLRPPEGVVPDKTHNLSLPIKLERNGWKVKNHYDDSTCFLVPIEQAAEAFKAIQAKRRRQVTPELLARLSIMRSKLKNPLLASVPDTEPLQNVS